MMLSGPLCIPWSKTNGASNIMWQPGWERSLGENRYMYMYGWVSLLFNWNYHIVNRLHSKTKYILKKDVWMQTCTREDTGRRQHQKHMTLWSWPSSLQNHEKTYFWWLSCPPVVLCYVGLEQRSRLGKFVTFLLLLCGWLCSLSTDAPIPSRFPDTTLQL